ncbi:PA2779 family protein [Ramlibacter alkalitolerans]|uniref:PA2779 family protein n=1 Tax=Ramlibacter alkalitolerans TaxID=2039631 RepID=A0ABS1JTX8_9BURK|nr:PA2779 family protein [Ramlibacter alkalitolerans]MBL0427306.1 PA2779 family protein [Ramlibacter alkalitolerans]
MPRAGQQRSRVLAFLLAAALVAPVPPAWSGMIGADALPSASQSDMERAQVQAFLERADLRERLQAMGVGGLNAAGRVAAMTDAEVHMLAQRIDALPAGGALSDRDILIIVVIAVIVAILL